MIFFLADPHLGHTNVLRFDNRPFDNIEQHDQCIINNWNLKVRDNDEVYVLGDISWYDVPKTAEIYENLKGKKHLILGNHDRKYGRSTELRKVFIEITDYKEINVDNRDLILSHYPIPCFNKHFYGAYHFYGHVHNSKEWMMMEEVRQEMIKRLEKPCNMINVGVMMPYMNYIPRTFEEIAKGYDEMILQGLADVQSNYSR